MSKPLATNPRTRNQQGQSRHARQLQLLEMQVRNQILAKARAARAQADAVRAQTQGGNNT